MQHVIDRYQLNLNIRANPADPEIFELSYCIDCGRFVAGSGLFPPVERQPDHLGHAIAWVPALDSALPPFPANGHIQKWLELYRSRLDDARLLELQNYSAGTGSINWAWLLKGVEQYHWLGYLDEYLNRLMDAWLGALEGKPSAFFPAPMQIWRVPPRIKPAALLVGAR